MNPYESIWSSFYEVPIMRFIIMENIQFEWFKGTMRQRRVAGDLLASLTSWANLIYKLTNRFFMLELLT